MNPPAPPRVALRPIQPADRAPLYAIHKAAMGPVVAQVYGWDEQDQRERWRTTAHDGLQVIEVDGAVAGYLEVADHNDHIEIRNIVLAPEAQGRGVGGALIADIIARAAKRGRDVRLRVHTVNHRAQAVYRRLGFVETGRTPTHIEMHRPVRNASR
jgi:ribosomal protein S18 acetylase RimI-like enzyme